MKFERRAVVDVGTNSVKLLVADVAGDIVQPVLEKGEQTRLGAGFYETQHLQPEAVARTARAVAAFVAKARQLKAVSTRVIATSAARDAINPGELTSAIIKICRVKVEIISGEQEADLAFRGVTSAPGLAGERLMLLDVGGGSTEFILGHGERRRFCRSIPMGALRLLQALPVADPPTARQLAACRRWVQKMLQGEVLPELRKVLRSESGRENRQRPTLLVGTGGTATVLARMEERLATFDRRRIEGVVLSREQVQNWVEKLWTLRLLKRKQIPGLPKKRADVILTGAVIFEGVMENLDFTELRVSTRGLRFAAVQEPVRHEKA